jgi:hypothetical protein
MVMAGEAGPEYMLPELALGDLAQRISEGMARASIVNNVQTAPLYLTIVEPGGKQIASYLMKASRDRTFRIDRGSLVG